MIHEHLQTHVIRENDVRSATHRRARVVRRTRIQFGQQKARLRAVLIAINQTRHGESSGDYLFRLRLGRREGRGARALAGASWYRSAAAEIGRGFLRSSEKPKVILVVISRGKQ